MNRIILIILFFISCVGITGIFGQTTLSFTAVHEGVSYPLDSIEIENISNGSKIVKYYPDTLLNLVMADIADIPNPYDGQLRLSQNYPNPFYDRTRFDISLSRGENVLITLFNASGKQILNFQMQLPAGTSYFRLNGGSDKLCFLSVKTLSYSAGIKMINAGHRNGSDPEIEYLGTGADSKIQYSDSKIQYSDSRKDNLNKKALLNGSKGEFDYFPGDSLRFTGYITRGTMLVLSDTIGDRPSETEDYIFSFTRENRIVILMYHDLVIGTPQNEYERNITYFENDLIYLRDNYQILAIDDLPLLGSGAMELEKDAVIITFDDGYSSVYSLGLPLLSAYNMPATFFLVTEWMDTSPYLTWNEVWILSEYVNSEQKKLFSMGSHTSSHPFLEKSAQYFDTHQEYIDFLNIELGDSKEWIVDITRQSDIFLSLPYGDGAYNSAIIEAAKNKGYHGIRTSVWNSFTVDKINMFALPSIPVLLDSSIKIIESYLDF